MTERTPPDRDDELLLARISEAAGRHRLGRRRATYPAAPRGATASAARAAAIREFWRAAAATVAGHSQRAGNRRRRRDADARLDFYEDGMTVAVNGRIHVVRYDTTSVLQRSARSPQGTTRAYALTDVDGEQVVLRDGDFRHPEAWEPEIRRAVIDAQLPRALAALTHGARLTFGTVWLTRERVGSGELSTRWPEIQRIEIRNGSVALAVAGQWQVLGAVASEIPNLFVLHALAEHLAGGPTTGAERIDE